MHCQVTDAAASNWIDAEWQDMLVLHWVAPSLLLGDQLVSAWCIDHSALTCQHAGAERDIGQCIYSQDCAQHTTYICIVQAQCTGGGPDLTAAEHSAQGCNKTTVQMAMWDVTLLSNTRHSLYLMPVLIHTLLRRHTMRYNA